MTDVAAVDSVRAGVIAAYARLHGVVRETPCIAASSLGAPDGGAVHLKLESLQHTGSFKARGAANRVLGLTADERRAGVVAASSGNHGAGVAWACRAAGTPALIFVPETASPVKVDAIRRLGAEVRPFGTDGLDTELHAREVADTRGMTYVSPYNDREIVAGQGTVAVEVAAQLPQLDAIYVAVGGGGLIGGIAAHLKGVMPNIRVIGAVPGNSPVMAASVRAGRIVDMESLPTLSDGTAGGVEHDAVTFSLCRDLVDEWVEVSEAEIAAAMRVCIEREHLLVEGAAGVAVAAYVRSAARRVGEQACVVICGANVSAVTLERVLREG
jgi:threonine dehydratase